MVAAVTGVSVGRTQLRNSSSHCLSGHSSEETTALRVRCGDQNNASQQVPLWHKDYFILGANVNQCVQKVTYEFSLAD